MDTTKKTPRWGSFQMFTPSRDHLRATTSHEARLAIDRLVSARLERKLGYRGAALGAGKIHRIHLTRWPTAASAVHAIATSAITIRAVDWTVARGLEGQL